MREKLCNLKDIFKIIYHFENEVKNITGNSINELLILCSLEHNKNISPKELSEEMGVSAGRISKILSSLEEKEFIERRLGKEDKRHMFFDLTNKGNEQLKMFQNSGIVIPQISIRGGNYD